MLRFVLLGCLAAACGGSASGGTTAPPAVAAADTARPWRKPGDKIDSILPMAEYVRRFREGLTEPAELEGGEASPEALARRFLDALAARDTASLLRLLVTRAEFAWLVFPDHLYARPPYELDPAIFWLQLSHESGKGLGTTLRRLGGQPLELLALECQRDMVQLTRGAARMWSPCRVRYREGDNLVSRRLFGAIVERNGRFKLMSTANEF